MNWYKFTVRYDGSADLATVVTDEEVDRVRGASPDPAGWKTVLFRDDLVIEEWFGPVGSVKFYRYFVYVRLP